MKKINIQKLHVALVVCVIQLSSCQKILDRFMPDHNHNSICRITSIKQVLSDKETRTGTFFYNKYGDLDSVIYDISAYGGNFFYYTYDESRRLIAYEADYDPAYQSYNYFHIHHYVYSDDGKIIIDTARIQEAGPWTQVRYLEYDASGRVIKETGNVIEAGGDSTIVPLTTITYEYDERGNLRSPDVPLNYDDKKSFLSTREVLMLTDRNYSKNNMMVATGYNEIGFPTGFPSNFGLGDGIFLMGIPSEISYDCW